MKALAFVACWGTFVSIFATTDIVFGQSPTPQVITVTGTTVMLPRQAGTKDAPDVTLATPLVAGALERSEKPINDVANPGRRGKR